MQPDSTSNFDWTLWSGKTPSLDTGPSSAFNGAYYIYMEASSPRVQGETTELVFTNTLIDMSHHMTPVLVQITPVLIQITSPHTCMVCPTISIHETGRLKYTYIQYVHVYKYILAQEVQILLHVLVLSY